MRIAGSCELPLLFVPENRARKVSVRVFEDLPYGLIKGTAFLRKHGSVIKFAVGGGFKKAQESPWVPFTSSPAAPLSRKEDRKAVGCRAATPPSEPEVEAATSVVARRDNVRVRWEYLTVPLQQSHEGSGHGSARLSYVCLCQVHVFSTCFPPFLR